MKTGQQKTTSSSRAGAVLAVLLFGALAASIPAFAGEPPSFLKDIRPLLAEHCFRCHGEDVQEGGLRLDVRSWAMRGGVSDAAITPGSSASSLLIGRVTGESGQARMPLEGQPLPAEKIAMLRRWIDEGAPWPTDADPPAPAPQSHWAYLPLKPPAVPPPDPRLSARGPLDVLLYQSREEAAAPLAPMEGGKLLRRVSLDLTGLPPSLEEIEAFQADTSPDAYERAVDRLLASPRYAEKWARQWLDLARYADSNGYQADQYREVWPYRDWVIAAISADMPFDQFTVEQLAGDLLPGATIQQQIATGFHRLTTCNVEAGVDPEENRVNQVFDRVNTTAAVWLGTTMECAQCHNHKYDPFSQNDFYRLFAYFNNTPLEVAGDGIQYDFIGPKLELPLPPETVARRDRLSREKAEAQALLEARKAQLASEQPQWEQQLHDRLAAAPALEEPPAAPKAIARILSIPAANRTAGQSRQLGDFHLSQDAEASRLKKLLEELDAALASCAPTTTLVMVEMPQPRETRVLRRGDFLDPLATVTPAPPRVLHPLPAGSPPNRLGLAEWLVDPANPLTARVVVNRWWAEFFGRGIVATLEDFGTQGEPADHPQALDYLACELRDRGWSMKAVHRRIVTSAAYRQSSLVSPQALAADPNNRRLLRAARQRLDAESLRDNALAISGLISLKQGGPPAYPPQPANHWRHVGRNAPKYAEAEGADRFRRGVYVVWRRSAPYPSFTNFDAPDRASCVTGRTRTNTPLQALTLLNDPAYVELAWGLAGRMATGEWAGDESPDKCVGRTIASAFLLCTGRRPSPAEQESLVACFESERSRLEQHARQREMLLSPLVELSRRNPQLQAARARDESSLGGWFFVASVLLNLDETITRD